MDDELVGYSVTYGPARLVSAKIPKLPDLNRCVYILAFIHETVTNPKPTSAFKTTITNLSNSSHF